MILHVPHVIRTNTPHAFRIEDVEAVISTSI